MEGNSNGNLVKHVVETEKEWVYTPKGSKFSNAGAQLIVSSAQIVQKWS